MEWDECYLLSTGSSAGQTSRTTVSEIGEAVLEVKSVEICGSMGFGPTLLSRLTAGTADRVGFFGVGVCEVFRRAQQKFGEAQ